MSAPFLILLVEDNPADAKLTRKVLETCGVPCELEVARDGQEALSFLTARSRSGKLPDLILLDLNLPRKDGRAALREIKMQSEFKLIPVVVLTTSAAGSDISVCYELQANCYINKPVDLGQFRAMIHSLTNFWFRTVTLPSRIREDEKIVA